MAPPASNPERAAWPPWAGAALLALVTVLVYLPSMRGGFIWDDDRLLTDNPAVKTIDGLYSIWLGNWAADYIPLTLSSFWLEWHLWGLRAAGYHIVSVLLHAANAVLLWRVLQRLGLPGSWLAALLFAVHPVCAASVTWIAERKNTLSMFFYLLSLGWFLRFDETIHAEVKTKESRRLLGFSLGAFFLALLAKSSVAVLPAVLLLFVWWRRGRVTRRDLDRCVPFFILAVLMALVAVAIQARAVRGGVGVIHDSLWVRLLGGSWAVWFYLGKIVLPAGLTMIYPRWEIDPRAALSYLPALGLAGLLFLFWRFRKSWGRPFLFAFGYFLVALAPALGIVDLAYFSNARVADHFQYLALPGMVALIAAQTRIFRSPWVARATRPCRRATGPAEGQIRLLAEALGHNSRASHSVPVGESPTGTGGSPVLPNQNGARHEMSGLARHKKLLAPALAAGMAVAALAFLTCRHEKVLADDRALWQDNLAKNPHSWKVCMNLSEVLLQEGKTEEAIELKNRAEALLHSPAGKPQ